jgi:preprotein translocase subunit SecA
MTHSPDDLVQRKHNYAIVDEVDSVLIDDARTLWLYLVQYHKEIVMNSMSWNQKLKNLVSLQRQLANGFYLKQKKLLKEGKLKKAESCFKSYRSLPKNKALIKF